MENDDLKMILSAAYEKIQEGKFYIIKKKVGGVENGYKRDWFVYYYVSCGDVIHAYTNGGDVKNGVAIKGCVIRVNDYGVLLERTSRLDLHGRDIMYGLVEITEDEFRKVDDTYTAKAKAKEDTIRKVIEALDRNEKYRITIGFPD